MSPIERSAGGGGGGVTSLDAITGAISLIAGANVTISDNSPLAGQITLAAAGGMTVLFDSTLGVAAATIDTGAGGFSTANKHLFILWNGRFTDAVTFEDARIRFNNDSAANYNYRNMVGQGGGVSTTNFTGQTSGFLGTSTGTSTPANEASIAFMLITNYAGTTFNKSYVTFSTCANTVPENDVRFVGGDWRATPAAINRITLISSGAGNFAAGTRLTVYGL